MSYRQKSWERVAHEVDYLADRYKPASIQFADNILSMDYFESLLPYWANRPGTISKFFEVKSNLNRHHLQVLKSAGVVHLQAGIENLADATLRIMKKGVTGAQNVAFLRWCAELGLQVHWNLIFGFPKEDFGDYQLNLTLMRNMVHLAPPDGGGPIRLDRFSPNYLVWKEKGFSEIRPMPAYRHVFALSREEDFWDIAYYFDYDQPNLEKVTELTETLLAQMDTWREKKLKGEAGELAVEPAPGEGYCLVDTRYGFRPSRLVLERTTTALIAEFDKPCNPDRAIERTANRFSTSREVIRAAFEDLVGRGVIAIFGNRAVTLTLLPDELRM
jgi:ribosomal peptide maturation radical SAM protein 1